MDAHKVLLELYNLVENKINLDPWLLLGGGLITFVIALSSCCYSEREDDIDTLEIRRIDYDLSQLTSQFNQMKKDVKTLGTNYQQIVEFLKSD